MASAASAAQSATATAAVLAVATGNVSADGIIYTEPFMLGSGEIRCPPPPATTSYSYEAVHGHGAAVGGASPAELLTLDGLPRPRREVGADDAAGEAASAATGSLPFPIVVAYQRDLLAWADNSLLAMFPTAAPMLLAPMHAMPATAAPAAMPAIAPELPAAAPLLSSTANIVAGAARAGPTAAV